MVHGKRTRLIPSDVDNSLIVNNIEVLYSHASSSIPFKHITYVLIS